MEKTELNDHDKALALISEGKIALIQGKENEGYFHVTGSSDEYLVLVPNFCSCEQFNLRSVNTPGNICYHILAVKMSGKIVKISNRDWKELLLKDH